MKIKTIKIHENFNIWIQLILDADNETIIMTILSKISFLDQDVICTRVMVMSYGHSIIGIRSFHV